MDFNRLLFFTLYKCIQQQKNEEDSEDDDDEEDEDEDEKELFQHQDEVDQSNDDYFLEFVFLIYAMIMVSKQQSIHLRY